MKDLKRFTFILLTVILVLASCTRAYEIELHVGKKNEHLEQRFIKQPIPDDFFPKEIRIVAIGDSLTQGVGDLTNQGGYLNYFKEHLQQLKGIKLSSVENFGVKGHKTTDLLKRLENEEIKNSLQQADLVIITIGGNDIMKVVKENITDLSTDVFNEEQILYEYRLKMILDRVKSYNEKAAILLIGLYNPFQYWFSEIEELDEIVNDWNETAEKVTFQYDFAYFVDISDVFQEGQIDLLFEDYFHPNNEGYERMAEEVFATFEKELYANPQNDWFVLKEEDDEN